MPATHAGVHYGSFDLPDNKNHNNNP